MFELRLWHLLVMTNQCALLQREPCCSLTPERARQALFSRGLPSGVEGRQPAPEHGGPASARPDGVDDDRVHPGGHEEGVQDIRLHARALSNGAGHDGACCGRELRTHAPFLAQAHSHTLCTVLLVASNISHERAGRMRL